MDCFAEFIIGRCFAPTRWPAMTMVLHEQKRHDEPVEHLRGGPVLQTLGHEANARLRRTNQDADREHDGAAEHDLEHRLQERRIHISRANIGDGP